MAYRKNFFDFGAKEGACNGQNAHENDCAFKKALESSTAIIEIEPGIYEISKTVAHDVSGKKFVGTDGNDCFGTLTNGTRLDWWGALGGQMVKIAPSTPGKDLIAPGFSNIQLNGNGRADRALSVVSTRRAYGANLQAIGLRPLGSAIAVYFGSAGASGAGDVNCSTRGEFPNMSISVTGAACGIMLDGLNGFGNTSGNQFSSIAITHQNGIAYYLRGCDNNYFFNSASARETGGTGLSIIFDGIDQYCMSNSFIGHHAGGWPAGQPMTIYSRGSKARQNLILPITGTDNPPNVIIEPASELTVLYTGGGYTPTLAGEKAFFRMPKRQELTY